MKKRIFGLLLIAMMATALVACSGEDNRTSDEVTNETVTEDSVQDETQDNDAADDSATDSVSILNDVWATYGENDKFYGMGGDMNNMVENAPGLFSLDDKDGLAATLLVKEDAVGMIDEAASLVHGMNLNVFTGAAFRLTDVENTQAFAESMKNSILNNQWMCGSPDQYMIYSAYEKYVVVAFGAVDVLPVFKEKFMTVHGDNVQVLFEGNVAQ